VTGPEPESVPAAADDDAVLLRVLGALRTESRHPAIPAPRRASCDERLPRRIPGANPGSHSPWPTQEPLRVVRDASSIAQTATGYMRGWRRGHKAALERRLSPATTAAAVARQPSSSRAALRRIAFRPGAAASRLVGLVVQVLPQGERRRYHEEFRAELSRLQGLHQLAYAIRLLLSALALRHALRQQRPGATGEE
jgi:hypothetical protein